MMCPDPAEHYQVYYHLDSYVCGGPLRGEAQLYAVFNALTCHQVDVELLMHLHGATYVSRVNRVAFPFETSLR